MDCNQSSFLILYVFTILHTRTLQNIATNIRAAIFMKERQYCSRYVYFLFVCHNVLKSDAMETIMNVVYQQKRMNLNSNMHI